MKGYLGEALIKTGDSPFRHYQATDWIRYWVTRYGGIDGAHHKQWLIDQCLRISMGTPVKVYQAKWQNGFTEWRVRLRDPSYDYLKWIENCIHCFSAPRSAK